MFVIWQRFVWDEKLTWRLVKSVVIWARELTETTSAAEGLSDTCKFFAQRSFREVAWLYWVLLGRVVIAKCRSRCLLPLREGFLCKIKKNFLGQQPVPKGLSIKWAGGTICFSFSSKNFASVARGRRLSIQPKQDLYPRDQGVLLCVCVRIFFLCLMFWC